MNAVNNNQSLTSCDYVVGDFNSRAKSIADMAYGSGVGEGTSGGAGHIGLIGGQVLKFNTKWRERKALDTKSADYADMKQHCDELRLELRSMAEELDALARGGRVKFDLKSTLKTLGFATAGKNAEELKLSEKAGLLTRKDVAKVLNQMISVKAKIDGCDQKKLVADIWGKHDLPSPKYSDSITAYKAASTAYMALKALTAYNGEVAAYNEAFGDSIVDLYADCYCAYDRKEYWKRHADVASSLIDGAIHRAKKFVSLMLGHPSLNTKSNPVAKTASESFLSKLESNSLAAQNAISLIRAQRNMGEAVSMHVKFEGLEDTVNCEDESEVTTAFGKSMQTLLKSFANELKESGFPDFSAEASEWDAKDKKEPNDTLKAVYDVFADYSEELAEEPDVKLLNAKIHDRKLKAAWQRKYFEKLEGSCIGHFKDLMRTLRTQNTKTEFTCEDYKNIARVFQQYWERLTDTRLQRGDEQNLFWFSEDPRDGTAFRFHDVEVMSEGSPNGFNKPRLQFERGGDFVFDPGTSDDMMNNFPSYDSREWTMNPPPSLVFDEIMEAKDDVPAGELKKKLIKLLQMSVYNEGKMGQKCNLLKAMRNAREKGGDNDIVFPTVNKTARKHMISFYKGVEQLLLGLGGLNKDNYDLVAPEDVKDGLQFKTMQDAYGWSINQHHGIDWTDSRWKELEENA